MLLEFTCSNYRSVREPVTLSLRAGPDSSFGDGLIGFEDERVNPACAIYGTNGTGKSSVLSAMSLMRNMVVSNYFSQPGDPLPRAPHKLWANKPTSFSMEFVWKKIRYIYEFAYDDLSILSERLSYVPNGRIAKIFDRKKNEFSAGEKFSRLESLCKEKLFPNKLALSLAVNNLNYTEIVNAFMFYRESLVVLLNENNNWLEYSAEKLGHDKAIKNMFLTFMKNTGSDMVDIKAKSERKPVDPASIPPDVPKNIRALILNTPQFETIVTTIYNGFSLDIKDESLGTQKLIRLMCPIMDIFQKNKTFVCDEIESHLHPLIVRQLVSRFINGKGSSAQIICATHNVEMLDLKLFRRDQIYFTDINPDGHRTKLFALSTLKPRKDDNVQKNYLDNKYIKLSRDAWGE